MSQATLPAPLQSTLVQWLVQAGDTFQAGQILVILEAMKMEHEVRAPAAGRAKHLAYAVGEAVDAGQTLLFYELLVGDQSRLGADSSPNAAKAQLPTETQEDGLGLRADLQRLQARLAATQDAARPQAMAKRHASGMRSARQNVADLCEESTHPGSFIEYGALAFAAQTRRRSVEDLVANTPADGMVCGIGSVNASLFGAEGSRTAIFAYDFTVLAGTQGFNNHYKTDRLLAVARQQRLPVVLFAEGGGGRPGDVDSPKVAGLHVPTFASFARLNGLVPVVGIVAGRCFAGNAALLGCCDVIIATRNSNIGMGGPAMIEGGGLGVYAPEEVGPSSVQHANGVIDVLVNDEAAAVAAARKYLAFFQSAAAPAVTGAGPSDFVAPETEALRDLVPENRLRVYDSRVAIEHIADAGSVLHLRSGFGLGIHTALGRIEGRAVGFMANNPLHLGGAIDADAADKAARFMQLCNAHGLPIVSLVDTPGFMVGPDIEQAAQVRHVSRMYIAAGHLRVPLFAVVLRKGYGLGAMAMTAGGFAECAFTISWPTGEFGGMGLEGAVRLGYRKELEAQPEGPARTALFDQLVAQHYEKGGALNMAAHLEIDAVIDPADTRAWLVRGLAGAKISPAQGVLAVDAW